MRADGKRTGVTEKFSSVGGVDAAFATNDFSWEYDAAGRLISETADASGGSLFNDYSETFVYDLTGNRVKQTEVSDNSSGSGSTTETTDYVYDANDRLLIETSTVGSDEKTSVYTYNKTQQTEKETTEYEDGGLGEPVTITTTQTFEYDLQGKLSKSTTTKDGGQALGSDGNSSTVYEYDSAGNRIAATTTRQNTVGGSTTTRIEYLTDSQNPTGYSQVLTETEFAVTVDANGNEVQTPIKEVVYTIGHDQISQTIFTPSPTGEGWGEGSTHHFGTDGHGSVRVLYDVAAAIAQNATRNLQVYHFDAYGNLLNENSVGKVLTVYLYSGEAFDFNIGLQYLRARLYDPNTARFLSLDPFAGNSSDPQSFHKYAYVHGDPIQGVDPSGMWFATALSISFRAGLTTGAISGGYSLIKNLSKGFANGFQDDYSLSNIIFNTLADAGIGFSVGFVGAFSWSYLVLAAGVSAGTASFAVGFTIGPSGLVLLGANTVNAFQNGDRIDKVFAVADVLMVSYALSKQVAFFKRPGQKVNVHNAGGGKTQEWDEVIPRVLFVEDKRANSAGLMIHAQETGMSYQTRAQIWANDHIYDSTVKKIQAVRTGQSTSFNGPANEPVPTIDELRPIRNVHFRVEETSTVVQQAVQNSIQQLRQQFPDFNFSAHFGKN